MFESCLRNFQKPDRFGRASFVCSGRPLHMLPVAVLSPLRFESVPSGRARVLPPQLSEARPKMVGLLSFAPADLFTCSRSQFFLRFALKASLRAERESCLRNFQKPNRFWSGFFRVTIIFFLIIRRNSLRRQKIVVNLQAENKNQSKSMKTDKQMAAAAAEFADRWEGRGYERGKSQLFWADLLI